MKGNVVEFVKVKCARCPKKILRQKNNNPIAVCVDCYQKRTLETKLKRKLKN